MIMDQFVTKRSLYHAKTGNFTGFCVSTSCDLNENKLDELYDHFLEIRGKMSNIDPETETWFTVDEFVEYQNNPQNITTMLFEIANIATRMKLRRAAKRTAKRRSRKRFMRRKIRKNQTQLRKRAYGQVKTLLRKRLSGGRPWSSISLSTRSRIDASINKRKSILTRMVKSRIPKMASQETKRLQRVRINSSYEPYYDNLILENKIGSRKMSKAKPNDKKEREKQQAKERQRRFRDRINSSITEFIKTVVVVKRDGQYELIEKGSRNSTHSNIQQINSIGDALSFCAKREDGDFRQTETSKKLCGVLEDLPKTSKKTKGNNQMASSTNSNNTVNNEQNSNEPEIPYGEQQGDTENLPEMFRNFKIIPEYGPEALELGISLVSRMNRTGNFQILEDIEDIQVLLENNENLTNDDIDMVNDIHERLMKSGLEEENIVFLVQNKNLYTTSNSQFKTAFMAKDVFGNIIYNKIPKFGFNDDTIQDYALIHMGRTSIGVIKEDLDGTSKSDMTAVHIPTVLSFLGKQNTKLSEKEINDLMTTHVNNINIATGGVISGSKNVKRQQAASIEYYNDFQEWAKEDDNIIDHLQKNPQSKFGVGVFQGFSLKEGPSRIGSSNVSGDGSNTLRTAFQRTMNSLSEEEKTSEEVMEFVKGMSDLFEEIGKGILHVTTTTGPYDQAKKHIDKNPIIALFDKTKEKLIKLIESLTTGENIKKPVFREFTKELIYISLTGDGRISPNSPGIATHIFYTPGKESPDAGVAAIDTGYIEKLLSELEKGKGKTDVIIGMVTKSGGLTSKSEKEYARKFDAHVKDIFERLKKGETIGGLTSKSKISDIEGKILGNIYSAYDKLNVLNGNRDELIKKLKNEGQDPKDITSELYLMENDIRDKKYNLRIVLNLINNIIFMVNNLHSNILTQSFSYNPVLSFLVERYSVLNEEIQSEQTKESLKEELNRYIDNAKRSIGTGPDMLGNMMDFFEIDFDIFTSPVDFYDVLPKSSTFVNTNTIYIGKEQIKVPISEYYKNIGKLFLSEAKKRDYKEEYKEFHGKPEERKKRSKRVLARRLLAKLGKVRKGDGKDVDHKDGNAMNNSPANLQAISAHKNRAKH